MTEEKIKPSTNINEEFKDFKNLVLHNDDFNTFDFVIKALIEVCEHEFDQAEQCTYIIHFKGKCCVKNGEDIELKSMKTELINRGLTATIE